jgi:hypothetical protein
MFEDDDTTDDEESIAKQYKEIKKKSKAMAKYDDHDYGVIGQVFHQLCELDGNRDPQWRKIRPLANEVDAYDKKDDVEYIAEQVLLELQFIERHPQNDTIRLTLRGKQNCARGIEIPPSDIQKLRMRLKSNII